MPEISDPSILSQLNGGGQSARGPVFGPGPKPAAPAKPPSGYTFDGQGGLVPIPGGPADPSAEPDKAPSGYRYITGGGLEPIPGGPAERGIVGNSVPQGAYEKAETYVSQFSALANALDTFQDDFAGNTLTGGLENTAQRYSPIPVGTPGQAQWWSEFKGLDNQIRNDLFGSALTSTEKAAYAQTTIEPGMNSDIVRANLKRRTEIIKGAVARRREFFLANGYKPEAVDAIFAPLLERDREPEAVAPPAFGDSPQAPPPGSGGEPPLPDLRPGAGLSNGDSTETQGLVENGVQREDNPVLSGVRAEYTKRLGEGQTAEQIIRWARSAGIDPTAYRDIQEQVRFRDKNPAVPIEQYDTSQLDDRLVQMGGFDQAVNAAAQSPLGSGIIAAGDAASGFTLDNIVGMVGGNAERARLGMGALRERNPVSSAFGTVAGGIATALGGEAALGAAGIRAGLPRALAADTAFGAAAGAGSTDDGSSRLIGAAQGGALAAGGSFLGQKAGNALAGVARGSSNPSLNTLRQAGVNDLTVGQTVAGSGRIGAAVKGVEDRLSGVPVIGDMVNARRTAGLRQFNEAAFTKALEPIGGSVSGKVGQEAIEDAQSQVSQAFTKALAGKGALPDEEFATSLASSTSAAKSIPRLGDEIGTQIDEIMLPYGNAELLSGEALDDISRSLRNLSASYKNDPLGNAVGKRIDAIERAIFDLFDRQASGTIPDYMAARRAYRRLSTLEDAVLKAQNQQDNVFTPAQLGQADKANTKRFGGKRAAARGDTPFNELQQSGQSVLPNKVPDSGTAGRLLVPLAATTAIGGGAAADQFGGTGGAGITIGLILSGAYSRAGQRILTKPMRGMQPNTVRRGVLENRNTARALGATGGAGSAALLTGPK